MSQTSFDKDKIKILLLEGVHDSALETLSRGRLREHRTQSGRAAGRRTCRARSPTCTSSASAAARSSPRRRSREARRLIAVGCFCIGTNQVALKDAMLRGVPVFNAPFSNTRSVAELVLAEAVLLLRGIPEKHGLLKQGVWQKSATASFEIRGKTLGVIGYGNIGSQLGVMAEALGMQVQFYDVVKRLNLGNARQLDSLDELLSTSDVVTLHVPEPPTTRNMIGARELALMKKTAVLINASRGNVVDLDALAAALQGQRLLGAAIDVYPEEPKSNDDPFVSPLLDVQQRDPDAAHRRQHRRSAGEHRFGSGRQADPLQRQRLDAVGGELPRSVVAAASVEPPAAAHPPQHSRCAVAHQPGVRRRRHQHRRAVSADECRHRLRGDRRRSGAQPDSRWRSCATSTARSEPACCSEAAQSRVRSRTFY